MRRHFFKAESHPLFKSAVRTLLLLKLLLVPAVAFSQQSETERPKQQTEESINTLDSVSVTGVAGGSPLEERSASSMGFEKTLLETPRTVSFVDSTQIDLLGINSVEDLTRAVPGVFTTTRFGLQGGIDVRGIPADMFFRGMKRVNMQGHARTNLSAMDSIEVVKGPPSPIYGMGKIGGYTNLVPKSGRATNGAYLDAPEGFVQAITGSNSRTEASAGIGGPMSVGDKTGGYYVYGLMEDSDSHIDKVSVKQKILQASISIDEAIGPFRLEMGGQYQNSQTSGAYMNRVTQALIDSGQYVSGMPLVNLELNGDGAIGLTERNLASPIQGGVSANNRPLYQQFTWPRCGNSYCAVGSFPAVSGIPQSMYDYLLASGADDSVTRLLLAQGPGGVVPTSGYLPSGFVLDPTTVGYSNVDYYRNGAYERLQDADVNMYYVDLIYDTDPDFTMKIQSFYDRLDSFKNSQLPYGEKQDIRVWEGKGTVTYRIPDSKLPGWLRVNTLASLNYRETRTKIRADGLGDYDWRQDVMYRDGTYIPNTLFWNQLDDPSVETGYPPTQDAESWFNQTGLGLMFDVDMFQKDTGFLRGTNLLLGARYDVSHAKGRDYRRFNETASYAYYNDEGGITYVNNYLPEQYAEGWDGGVSWSFSLSQQLPWGLRPYLTYAKSSVTLDSWNNLIDRSTITSSGGHVGDAELHEQGIKADLLGGKLSLTVSHYKQTRTDVATNEDVTLGAEVSSTETKGWEGEFKWMPVDRFYVSGYFNFQKARYLFNSATSYLLNGRQLGFQDVRDPGTGEVVYPAEAFLYGGRTTITVPAEILANYMDRTGNPETQYGLNAGYNFDSGFGIVFGGTYWSSVWNDRLKTVRLPSATVFNLAATYKLGDWNLKLNGYNIFDELYFRAPFYAELLPLVSVMPPRRFELTARYDF
ncbi:MAG TPA: TonB-dependent receptor [Rariglobus sp.]